MSNWPKLPIVSSSCLLLLKYLVVECYDDGNEGDDGDKYYDDGNAGNGELMTTMTWKAGQVVLVD